MDLLQGLMAALLQKDGCAEVDDGSGDPPSKVQSPSSQTRQRLIQALPKIMASDPTENPGGRIYSGGLAPDR